MAIHCSSCGAELLDEAKFCSKCGVAVPAEAQPAELTGPPAGEVEPALRRVPSRRWRRALVALSVVGILAGGGLLVWIVLGGAGGDKEEAATEGAVSPAGSPGQQIGTPSATAVQDFAQEYIRRGIDNDQPWLREHTISGYYEFSLPWFRRLETCDALAVREGPVEKDPESSDWIAPVTFDPPCAPHHVAEVGTTFTLVFEVAITKADLLGALSGLGHPEAVVDETVDGSFLVRMGTLEGLADVPPVGLAPPSEREAIEQTLEERLGDFRVLDFASFGSVGPDDPYACVLLRIEGNKDMKAAISRWFMDEGDCSPNSPWFAGGFGDPSFGRSYVLLEADTSQVAPESRDDAMEGVVSVIQRRADLFGLPVELRRQGSDRLSAVVYGVDPGRAREFLSAGALPVPVQVIQMFELIE